ncbi:MAG TPA: hypothetical protein VFS67_12430 [Polyangiaceae bacterium]|nr:hypothetical protein [Polyangiaceae bacterium]
MHAARCLSRGYFALLMALGCGSAPPAARPPAAPLAQQAEPPPPARASVAASAELGGLDERAAEQSFRDSLEGLQSCIQQGVERLEFIGGSIEFAVKVDSSHRAAEVWAAESTLGERGTEKCMFDVLRSVSWPSPQGGAFGIARNSFDFKPRKGVTAPAVWDASRISRVLAGLNSQLQTCRDGAAERLIITLYIGRGGKALGGGVASAEPVADGAVDCVMRALLAANYPAPEHAPTKVRFEL